MGSGNSALNETTILVRFSQQNKKVYQTGETVSGIIECIHNFNSDVRLKNASIEIIGELVYPIQQGKTADNLPTTHHVRFFNKRYNLHTNDNHTEYILKPGNHTWPFSFHLDDSLPPSLKQTRYEGPCILYYICVRLIQRDWYKLRIEQHFPIVVERVLMPINIVHIENQNVNRKGVHIHVLLDKNVAVSGRQFPLEVEIKNPRRALIHRISAILVEERVIGSKKEKHSALLRKNIINHNGFLGEHLHDNFNIFIPKNIVASFAWKPKDWPFRNPCIVRYELQLEAHIHGHFNNIQLRFPLIITNNLVIIENENEMTPPPSYHSLFLR